MVGDTPIDEAEIAREMQFHRADDPHAARQAAATTLVIRELVRRECERLQLAVEAIDGETEDEARVRVLVDAEVALPEADEAALRQYYEANQARLHHPDAIRAAVAGSPGAVSNRVSAAAQAAMASACWMRTSAAPCCRLWKLPIGWPNCTRTLR